MVVVHTILIGFLGNMLYKDNNNDVVIIATCIFGLVLTVLWWAIISFGWSLTEAWWNGINKDKEEDDLDKIYREWKKTICRYKCNMIPDLIWWFSHLVIACFFIGYMTIGTFIIKDECIITGVYIACFLSFIGYCFSLCIMMKTKDIKPS